MTIAFYVDGTPVPKGRPRHTKNGGTYTPKRTRDYEERIGWAWKEATSHRPFEGPVSVNIAVDEKGGHPADLDNYVKAALDALNGLAFADDKQVVVLFATVNRGSEREGMGIAIRECKPARVTVARRKKPMTNAED